MTKTPEFRRRTLLKGLGASALLPLLSANLIGCSDSSDARPEPAPPESVPATFEHGVASGDPLEDRVILWTRATPEREGDVIVEWELATDEAFSDIVASGSGATTAAVDYTVKVDASGLAAGTSYFYRFRTGENLSPVGRTRSAPNGALTAASFAVVSCSNYPAGLFHVYREIAGRDVDAVLHLGDYIYEYAADGYASENAEALGRLSEPAGEILSLQDYRTRYAQYRGDADLQACHARHPFVVVWDDHEVANDSWREGAENHDPATEGDFGERRAAAIQAWFEWLPVRPPSDVSDIIYRQFRYGDLLDLIMLDTRNVGRDLQVDYTDFVNGGQIDSAAVLAATGDSNRSLLGGEQLAWVKDALTSSTTRWQVLGQQVLMARQPLPEPVVRALNPATAGEDALQQATAAVLAAVQARNKAPEDRTAEEQALLDSAIPFNPDAWDGYAFEREDLLNHASQVQSRLVVLAGDTHNAWASQLTTADGSVVGAELACPSVTSPGAEAAIGADAASLFGPLAVQLMDDLKYANLVQRGFLQLAFSADAVQADWVFLDAIDSPDYVIDEQNAQRLSVDRNSLLLG
ncbi:alkaline phosphatase D family protein [Parahaliea aestuarii]|uniref:Alkaline phosphatase n=1 Tax=Parahaliea aestuarii TaxID=1852021 RepID=A0A5C8ZVH9_9GAMM|nr:alkaline phosphatase D family protein [Parahaliea aestuarii]TXS91580.1 alkaline phosphatase [Parahaliea aestuarii]